MYNQDRITDSFRTQIRAQFSHHMQRIIDKSVAGLQWKLHHATQWFGNNHFKQIKKLGGINDRKTQGNNEYTYANKLRLSCIIFA